MEGLVASILLVAGGLGALQSVTIASALPFAFVMLALVWSLFVGMQADLALQEQSGRHLAPSAQPAAGLTWQRRLALMLHAPSQAEVKQFIAVQVRPALEQVARELNVRGRSTSVTEEDGNAVVLRSPAEGFRDFVYGVAPSEQRIATFTPIKAGQAEYRHEARTYFSSGTRGYDIMGMTRDQLIADVLAQFEQYLHLAHSPESQLLHGAPEHQASPATE